MSDPKLLGYRRTSTDFDNMHTRETSSVNAGSNKVHPDKSSLNDGKMAEASNGYVEMTATNGKLSTDDTKEPSTDEGEEKKEEEIPMVSMREIFRFAGATEKLMMFVGFLSACLNGAALPMMIIVFGEMTDLFIYDSTFENWLDFYWDNITAIFPNASKDAILGDPDKIMGILEYFNQTEIIEDLEENMVDDFMDEMTKYAIYYTVLGCIVWVLSYLQVAMWQMSAFRQTQTIRTELFRSILRQEIGWFDTHESGELNTRLSDDVMKVQEGIGDKLGLFFQWFSAFIAGFVIGFIYGWELTLVILAVSPLIAISGGVMAKLGSVLTTKELKAYAKAGAVAEEVFSCMRTVVAFGGQKKESQRYCDNLYEARSFGVKKGAINGIGMGTVYSISFASFGLAFWVGSILFLERDYSAGDILVVFFAVLIGAFAIGNAGPNFEKFSKARGAASALFEIIDWEPSIDSSSSEGITPSDIQGNIEFKDVVFRYPSRPEITILNGLNLSVNVGETVALVGSSGCGKSTTVQLLQRFYDVEEGRVLIDGKDVKDYNLKWLRQHIGVVSQEPVLFQLTIEENIRYGKEGVTMDDIIKAAQMANAHDFISKLPEKYGTLVGERGAQLSGGQKQRIAIARALVRDPKILLLDEATSALDTESEAIVQSALDRASEGRTTIVIAHRLSTVRNADKIAGFTEGRISEIGNHDELMKVKGVYHTLCTNQTMDAEDEDIEVPQSPAKESKEFLRSLSVHSHGGKDSPRASVSHRNRTLSTTSHKETTKKDEEEEEEDLPPAPMGRLMQMNSSEWPYIVLGCFAAIVCGCVQPAFAVLFAEILGAFSIIDEEEFKKEANLYSILFVAIGIVNGLAMFTQGTCFARSGEYLTFRLRRETFDAYLRQDISYFDDPKNNTGALCTRLATDASAVQGATGARLGTILQSFASIGCGLAIGFVYSWELTLGILGFAPFFVIAGFIQMSVFTGKAEEDTKALEEAGKLAIEAIENMRTVATLTKEDKFYQDYCRLTAVPFKKNLRKAHVQGLAYGFSQACIYYAYAACFMLGGFLVSEKDLYYEDMFKVFSAITFSAQSVGEASSFAPDYGKAKSAAARLFVLFDRVPLINSLSEEGAKVNQVEGDISLKKASFSYPNRDNIQVLQNMDLEVPHSQMIALVGSSGCGKSTIIQLVERFYDPTEGQVCLDNDDFKGLHLQWLRSQMGIVSQEPVLFDCSISENIAYGDNSRDVPMSEIIEAAKNANIHNFIQTLPSGYDTNVGDKGTQLSGGQKQRVAIARALVRNPKILLLDEATSALDTESEKVVQEALDKAQKGRTSIVIAHRLSTVQGADRIFVVQHGRITETGTHSQLLAKKGFYYKLNNAQTKKKQ